MKWMATGWISIIFGLAGTGCLTSTPPPADGPYDAAEVNRIFSAGKDPSQFFIHSYPGESGRTVFSGQNRQPSDERAVLLFESPVHSAMPVVRARTANGTDLFLLIDTTSKENWTNLGYRDQLGFVPLGPQPIGAVPAHLFDEIPGYLSVFPELTFDRMTVSSVLVYARALRGSFWPMHRHADAREATAVMGVDFLRSFAYVTWDYASRLMTLSSTAPYEPVRENVLAELPINFDPDLGAIEIPWVIDGQEGAVIFDCAGDYELAVVSPPLDLIRQVGLQDLILRRVRAVSPQSVGLQPIQTPYIGNALLRRYRVTLDNHRNVLWIETVGLPATRPEGLPPAREPTPAVPVPTPEETDKP